MLWFYVLFIGVSKPISFIIGFTLNQKPCCIIKIAGSVGCIILKLTELYLWKTFIRNSYSLWCDVVSSELYEILVREFISHPLLISCVVSPVSWYAWVFQINTIITLFITCFVRTSAILRSTIVGFLHDGVWPMTAQANVTTAINSTNNFIVEIICETIDPGLTINIYNTYYKTIN